MTKRGWALLGLAVATGCALVLLIPTCRLICFGLLQNEQRFRGRPTRYWTRALADPDVAAFAETCRILNKGGSKAIPMLLEALADADPQARYAAAEVLGAIGPDAVPPLTEALKTSNPLVRIGAARALGRIGPEAQAAIPALGAATEDEVTLVTIMAVTALGRIGKEAIPILTQVLRDKKELTVRRTILEAFCRLGPEAAAAVPLLLEVCKDEDSPVYDLACEALRKVDAQAAAKAGIP
jgi:HEAT repeat protein